MLAKPDRIMFFLLYFLICSLSLCSIKEIGIQNSRFFGDTSLLAFQIRLLFLALALISRFIGLHAASRVSWAQ